ncbi:hypothetical protein HK099_003553 [Clydaea vesicula]|uniref:Uncharacterized protein n=1 Tax=Clydaea vesicula TaxID=447962 RepID=A0AAD5XYT4_9FUNG|nr:hypothetical protein HK099_003553 [Clydaea vesicula]
MSISTTLEDELTKVIENEEEVEKTPYRTLLFDTLKYQRRKIPPFVGKIKHNPTSNAKNRKKIIQKNNKDVLEKAAERITEKKKIEERHNIYQDMLNEVLKK